MTAPDAATADQIVALAHQMRLACLNWIDLPPGSERGYKSSMYQASIDKLRAAVEQVILKASWYEEALRQCQAQRDSARESGTRQRERAERAEAENLAMRQAFGTAGATFDVAYIRRLMRAEAERDALLAQLPDGMKHCTILFKECEKGHGTLTATNWIQHGCLVCERDALRAEVDGRRPMTSVEGMVQRSRAERVEAERDNHARAATEAIAAQNRAEAERDALKGLLLQTLGVMRALVGMEWPVEPATSHDGCYTNNPLEKCARIAIASAEAAITPRPPSAALPSDDPHSLS